MPIAILVFGAQTGIGVGLPNLFGSGRGLVAYDLAFRSVRSVHCGLFFGNVRSRRHCINGEDILYNQPRQLLTRKKCSEYNITRESDTELTGQVGRQKMKKAVVHRLILDRNV